MSFSKIALDFLYDGQVARIALAAPKANILDRAMIAELEHALAECDSLPLHAIVITAQGPHFSFGASVQEHLPEHIAATLSALHALLRRIGMARAPVIAAVRGQCLGGGLELALACDLILAEKSATFAAPEIKLGVFPPAAAAILPVRIGASPAAGMVLTGKSISGDDAHRLGLASSLAAEGSLDAELARWIERDFLSRSPDSLRLAAKASRSAVRRALEHDLPELERLYLEELMSCADPVEGIRAFLEKREPHFLAKAAAK